MHKTRTIPSRKTRDTSSKIIRVQKYLVCDNTAAMELASSYLNKGNVNLHIICKIETPNCRYKLKCNLEKNAWSCKTGQHIYTSVVCCDFVEN